MSKKITAMLCVMFLLISLVGCTQSENKYLQLKGYAVSPYELNEREQFILNSYGVSEGCLMEYNAPKEAKSVELSIYRLDNSKWAKNNSLTLPLYTNTSKDIVYRGLISIQTNGASDEFIINAKVNSASSGSAAISSSKLEGRSEYFASSPQYLEEEKNIELGKEIPIAIFQYSTGFISSLAIEDFFTPINYKDVELVQAVTVKFN